MSTTLKRQLAALAAAPSSLLVPERRRSSILFNPSEAAKYDREAFYQIGQEGLLDLVSVNHELFSPFLNSIIFSEASKTLERTVENENTNKQLDERIEDFLIAVSPYLMIKSSLKAMEWLIYRFHIEKFNIDSILQCILPFHDTKSFVLIIQVLELGKYNAHREWKWLEPYVESGMAVPKAILVGNANVNFVLWLFATLGKFLTVHFNQQTNLRVYIAFMTSTLVGIMTKLNRKLMTKTTHNNNRKAVAAALSSQIKELLETIQGEEGVRYNEEINAMMYILTALLQMSMIEIPELRSATWQSIRPICKSVLRSHSPSQSAEAYLLLNYVTSSLKLWNISKPKTLKKALIGVSDLSNDWDMFNLTYKFILSNAGDPNILSSTSVLEWIEKIEMTIEQRSEILREVYLLYKNPNSDAKIQKWAQDFLETFERQYPLEFHLASQVDEQFSQDIATNKTKENLALLSKHPDAKIRAKSVTLLLRRVLQNKPKEKITKKGSKASFKTVHKKNQVVIPDKNPTAKLLSDRFTDDDVTVALVVLKLKLSSLKKIFTAETLIERLSSVASKRASKKCVKLSLKKLCSIAKTATNEQKRKILMSLVPFLFPRKTVELQFSQCILQSKLADDDEMLSCYNKVLEEELTAEGLSKLSYQVISASTFMSNNFVWDTQLSTPSEVLFACFYSRDPSHIDDIIASTEKFPMSSVAGFPVTQDNFNVCVELAEKKGKLSLDMVLTSFLKMTPINEEQIQKILMFVWQAGENVDNKNSCLLFMKQFIKKLFVGQKEEAKFWYSMLLQVCVDSYLNDGEESNDVKVEYLAIRTLQFATAFIKSTPSPKVEKEKDLPILPTTSPVRSLRNRLIQKDSPAKKKVEEIVKNVSNENTLDMWPILELLLSQFVSHKSHRVRLWSLNCIKQLKDKIAEPQLKMFVNQVLEYEKEIVADDSQGVNVVARLLSLKNFEVISKRFKTTVLSLKADPQIILGILNIFKNIGPLVFKELTPLAKQLLGSNLESEVLMAVLDCYDGSLNDTDLVIKLLQHKNTYKKVTAKITRDVYENYNVQDKRTAFNVMVNSALECELAEIKVAVQRCVRKWILDATILAHELVKCIGMQKRNSMTGPGGRRPSSDKNSTILDTLDAGWTKKTEVVLEFIQSKKNLKNKTKLIVPLFRILKTCILLEEQSPVEYLKQLVLTALTIGCQEDETSTDSNDWVHFNVELIIDCLRCSRNPQTHHHALILLNYAAKRFPEQVLHGVMSLFTFMGNSILRQDDTYSTQLIQQTVTSIIPTLANTGRGNVRQFSTNLVSAGIFRVFTSAVQDIPVHRRLPVFTSLVETLEPTDSMWQICIIIVDNALNRDKKRSNLNADLELATDLVWKFKPEIVVLTLEKMFMFLSSLPLYNRELSKDEFLQARNTQDATSKSILDFSRKECFRDIQLVILFTLELASKVGCKFESCGNTEVEYDSLLEKCLSFSRLVSGVSDDKIFRLIAHRNFEVIEKINSALDPSDFVRVVVSILKRDDMTVKKKIMDMLNQRILQKVEWFGDLKILVNLLEPLVAIAKTASDTEENVVLIQTAFLSLKLIAKHIAQSYPEEFHTVCELAFAHATNKNRLLCSSALLCMGELFCLKSMILPSLKEVTSAILKALKSCTKQQLLDSQLGQNSSTSSKTEEQHEDHSSMTANLLCLSTMTCCNKLVEQLGSFIGARFLQKFLTAILKIDGKFGFGEKADNRKKVFDQRLKVLLKSVAAKIPLRNSLVPIRGAFSDLITQPKNIVVLMGLLKENLVATAKPDFSILSGPVSDAFLEDFLPFREKLRQSEEENVEEVENEHDIRDINEDEINRVEDSILDCLITGIVLKMSEGHFRPFYHRIFDWTEDNLHRLITFYRFSAAAAERLKSLFTTFAGYVINKSASFLNMDVRLTKSLLKFFYHIFFNDREGFITNDRFNSLIKPLVDLIESDYLITGQIQIQELNNTIVQLAVATNDLNRWQHLIELISYKSQHKNSVVRLYIISTLEAAANELGKDFLPLLPPAVPFLADLMGDDDPAVEAETQKMLLKLENIVGEPLQSYFTT